MLSASEVPYRELLNAPGRRWLLAATAIGRLPNAMRTMGCILMVEQITGSYGLGGLVGATQALVFALVAPVLGRLIDTHGERIVVMWAMMAHFIGVAALIWVAYSDMPRAYMLPGAAIFGGSAVQFGSISRARWAKWLPGGRALERAYSLEGMIDEICFIFSPMIVVVMALQIHPTAGVITSMTLTALATVLLLVQPVACEVRHQHAPQTAINIRGSESVIGIPTVTLISSGLLLMGIFFGSAQITAIAFTEHFGQPGAVAWIAVAIGLASFVGAALYGARPWPGSIGAKIIFTFWWVGLSSILFLVAPNVPTIIAAGFVMGLATAPAIIAANLLVEQVSPPERITEAFTWLASAVASGSAIGSVVAGYLVDEYGFRVGMMNAVAGGVACGLCVTLGRRYLRAPATAPILIIP